jgi:hypothetical protein
MRSLFPILALICLILPSPAITQTVYPTTGDITLASGETVSLLGVLSYNKLRRGTEIGWMYQIVIHPNACFLLVNDVAAGRQGVKLQLTPSPGLLTKEIKQAARSKSAIVNKAKVTNCSDAVQFKARIEAPPDQPLGMQKVSGQITWQARNTTGVLPAQTTQFEFPIEVVEHGDRTAEYNPYYGYRPGADLLWRIPSFPFVLMYCGVKGDPECLD